MKIENRFIKPNDFYKVSELSDFIFQSVSNKSFFSWDRQSLLSELKTKTSGVLASENQKILGFIVFREAEDLIDIMTLGTDPQYRAQGIMSDLLQYLLKYSSKENKKVLLEVHEENRLAIQLYLKMGFQVLYKRERYYKDGGNALVMVYGS